MSPTITATMAATDNTVTAVLEAHNFVVTAVKNGVEGLREVMAMDFDVIICDMLMPGMPGDMFYIAVQRVKPHLCQRFVFVTGHGGNPKVTEFLDKADGLIMHKPVGPEALLETISWALQRGRRAS